MFDIDICLVPSKDDPLKFVFWKKRLRDLREDIKKDALAKLKAECPTLFNMGWFKVGANYIGKTAPKKISRAKVEK